MKIAYVFDINNKYTYAGITVAKGFKNAFTSMSYHFEYFDIRKMKDFWSFSEYKRLKEFKPDIIFASVDDIRYLHLNKMPATNFVLWGSFFYQCNYEKQISSILNNTKALLSKYKHKHNFLIWSQHSNQINNDFFSGYTKEVGLKFIQLLHCADLSKFIEPLEQPEFDFLWIGNINHRLTAYNEIIVPLKKRYTNYLEFSERSFITPEEVGEQRLYQRSYISPNIHTPAQIIYNMGLNERVFTSSLMGGFQICDNMLAREYFAEDELIIATNKDEFIEYAEYFRSNSMERINYIKRIQKNILENHTYNTRIQQILETL